MVVSEERERGEFKTRLGVRDDVDITELLMSREICDFFFIGTVGSCVLVGR